MKKTGGDQEAETKTNDAACASNTSGFSPPPWPESEFGSERNLEQNENVRYRIIIKDLEKFDKTKIQGKYLFTKYLGRFF